MSTGQTAISGPTSKVGTCWKFSVYSETLFENSRRSGLWIKEQKIPVDVMDVQCRKIDLFPHPTHQG